MTYLPNNIELSSGENIIAILVQERETQTEIMSQVPYLHHVIHKGAWFSCAGFFNAEPQPVHVELQ